MAPEDRPGTRKTPAPARQTSSDVESTSGVRAFLDQVQAMPRVREKAARGRLLFAMDATASREPTWDMACQIQGDMFAESATLGGLDVRLLFYRGFRELKTTPWVSSAAKLIPYMTRVRCLGGQTQLERMLDYAIRLTREDKIDAMVFVGDALEEEIDAVCAKAGELGMLGVRCFVFQEGQLDYAERGFRQIAKLTRGAYCRFDAGSAAQLKALLGAVAVYAAGGRQALLSHGDARGGEVLRIAHQVR